MNLTSGKDKINCNVLANLWWFIDLIHPTPPRKKTLTWNKARATYHRNAGEACTTAGASLSGLKGTKFFFQRAVHHLYTEKSLAWELQSFEKVCHWSTSRYFMDICLAWRCLESWIFSKVKGGLIRLLQRDPKRCSKTACPLMSPKSIKSSSNHQLPKVKCAMVDQLLILRMVIPPLNGNLL